VSPRTLEVPTSYRKRRLWPWVVAFVVLLAVGLWGLRLHRAAPAGPAARAPGTAAPGGAPVASARPTMPPPPRPEVRSARLAGRVSTQAGQPAPGVTVAVAPSGLEARTDGEGRFQLEAEEGATVRLEAHHSDLGFASTEVRAPATNVELRLAPRAGLEVQVLSEGRPVAGATLTARQRGGEAALFHSDRVTDASGALRFLGLPGGRLEVEALLEETGARSGVELDVPEGTVARVLLLLPVVGVVRGTVVNRAGAPVAGAFVGVEPAEGLPARSGQDGTFILKGLRTGRDHRLTARTPELALDTPMTARAGQSDVRLVLRDRPVFRGRVLGPGGEPLRTFSVEGRPFEAEDGRFAMPLEPREGLVELRVAAHGMLTRTVTAGGTVSELGDIAMKPAPALQGRVMLGAGRPAANAEVSAGGATTRSDATGAFTLPVTDPPPSGGPITVHAVQGELAGSAEARLGAQLEIVLVGEQPVRVQVFAPDGTPARGRAVQLAGLRSYSWTTGEDGTVVARALAGEYSASTEAQPGRVWFVRVPSAGIVLGGGPGAASLEVDVDAPVEALWVEKGAVAGPISSERPGPRGEGQLLFGVERSARFDGLSPGTWTVVGLRQGTKVLRTVQVSGATRLSL